MSLLVTTPQTWNIGAHMKSESKTYLTIIRELTLPEYPAEVRQEWRSGAFGTTQ